MGRGAVYGLLVFGLAQVMFALMRAMGLMPSAGDGELLGLIGSLMGSMIGHLLFGAVMVSFFSTQRAPVMRTLA